MQASWLGHHDTAYAMLAPLPPSARSDENGEASKSEKNPKRETQMNVTSAW